MSADDWQFFLSSLLVNTVVVRGPKMSFSWYSCCYLAFFFTPFVGCFDRFPQSYRPYSAVAIVKGTSKFPSIRGQLYFEQPSAGGPVIVRGTIEGLTPGLHGLHVHQHGNLTDDCNDAGAHFNPFNRTHGDRESGERHVGDLGNVEAVDVDHPRSATRAHVYLVDWLISLAPGSERAVANRAVVVHERPDDLGLGQADDSKKTGNAGGRVACGLITLVSRQTY